jgi:hypothetical protein
MEPEYAVQVTQRDGEFELRIRELLLVERGPNLKEVYARLIERKREIIDWARTIDSLDELPQPKPVPPLGSVLPRLPGGER